jgi:hypothetical protein
MDQAQELFDFFFGHDGANTLVFSNGHHINVIVHNWKKVIEKVQAELEGQEIGVIIDSIDSSLTTLQFKLIARESLTEEEKAEWVEGVVASILLGIAKNDDQNGFMLVTEDSKMIVIELGF